MARSRTTIGIAAIAIVIVLIVAAVYVYDNQSAAPKTPITIDTWGGYYTSAFQKVAANFTQQTGIQVNFIAQGSTQAELQKIEAGSVTPDIWTTAPPQAYQIGQSGKTVALTNSSIASLTQVPNTLHMSVNGQVMAIGYETTPIGLAYRTDKISAPTSYSILANTSLAGHVGLLSPSFYQDATLLQLSYAYGGNVNNTTPGWNALLKIAPNVGYVAGTDAQAEQMLTSGNIYVALTAEADAFGASYTPAPVGFVIPPGPTYLEPDFMVVLNNGHVSEAQQFVNYFLEATTQVVFTTNAGTLPVNINSQVPANVQSFIGTPLTTLYSEGIVPNNAVLINQEPNWANQWNSQIAVLIPGA